MTGQDVPMGLANMLNGSSATSRVRTSSSRRSSDPQRFRLYKAEVPVFFESEDGNEFRHLEQCEAFLKSLKQDKVLNRWYPKLSSTIDKVVLGDGRRRRAACCESNFRRHVIKLPVWSRSRWTICHELAHAMVYDMYGFSDKSQPHGWQFARIYMFLIQRVYGKDKAEELKQSYRKHKVKFQQPKKKRELSPERKAELQERMKKMQEAKKAKKEAQK